MYPYTNPSIITKGLSLLKGIKWGTILDGTQKTLGVINQAIPIVYQVKPIINNAKTMLNIAKIVNSPTEDSNNITSNKETKQNNNSPIFYI